jgi:hypothetical protein
MCVGYAYLVGRSRFNTNSAGWNCTILKLRLSDSAVAWSDATIGNRVNHHSYLSVTLDRANRVVFACGYLSGALGYPYHNFTHFGHYDGIMTAYAMDTGAILWMKTWGDPGGNRLDHFARVVMSSGTLWATATYNREMRVLHIDPTDGSVVHMSHFDDTFRHWQTTHGHAAAADPTLSVCEGRAYVGVRIWEQYANLPYNYRSDVLILALDYNHDVLWANTLTGDSYDYGA